MNDRHENVPDLDHVKIEQRGEQRTRRSSACTANQQHLRGGRVRSAMTPPNSENSMMGTCAEESVQAEKKRIVFESV